MRLLPDLKYLALTTLKANKKTLVFDDISEIVCLFVLTNKTNVMKKRQ